MGLLKRMFARKKKSSSPAGDPVPVSATSDRGEREGFLQAHRWQSSPDQEMQIEQSESAAADTIAISPDTTSLHHAGAAVPTNVSSSEIGTQLPRQPVTQWSRPGNDDLSAACMQPIQTQPLLQTAARIPVTKQVTMSHAGPVPCSFDVPSTVVCNLGEVEANSPGLMELRRRMVRPAVDDLRRRDSLPLSDNEAAASNTSAHRSPALPSPRLSSLAMPPLQVPGLQLCSPSGLSSSSPQVTPAKFSVSGMPRNLPGKPVMTKVIGLQMEETSSPESAQRGDFAPISAPFPPLQAAVPGGATGSAARLSCENAALDAGSSAESPEVTGLRQDTWGQVPVSSRSAEMAAGPTHGPETPPDSPERRMPSKAGAPPPPVQVPSHLELSPANAAVGVSEKAVGFPGALAEGTLAKLNKKSKEWVDRFCVLSCKGREGAVAEGAVDFAYVLEVFVDRDDAMHKAAPVELVHVDGATVQFVQGTVFTVKTTGALNKKGATHFLSANLEEEARTWLHGFEVVPDVEVVWTGKDGSDLRV